MGQFIHIESVNLKGYKSIRDLSVDIKEGLNIIIGANGSGKTNFMEFLNLACRRDYAKLFDNQNRKFEYEIKGSIFLTKIIGSKVFQSEVKGAAYRIEKTDFDHDPERVTKTYLNEEMREVKSENDTSIYERFFLSTLLGFNNPLNDIFKEKLSLFVVRQDVHSEEDETISHNSLTFYSKNTIQTFLKDFFHNQSKEIEWSLKFDTIISKIIQNQWFSIDALRENLNQFSLIKDVKFDWAMARTTVDKDYFSGESASIDGFDFHFFVNEEWINWNQLSDGTKRLFYIIGSVTYAAEETTILIEEPELGIHPHQVSLLMDFLMRQSQTRQIIISTHAPEVLNCLKATELDRIIVARHEGKAGTKMYKLNEKEQKSLQTYMKNQASISDYWLQTGFEFENKEVAV